MSGRGAIFLDRDGVLVEPVPHVVTGLPEAPHDPGLVTLVPRAPAALNALRDAGWALVVVSNQPAAAKGTATMAQLRAAHARAAALLAEAGAAIDSWRYCFHHPEGTGRELGRVCDCRKPAPGMLFAAAEELGLDLAASWMVGDSDSDVAAGRAADCRTVLIEHPGSAHRRMGGTEPTLRVADLWDAVSAVALASRASLA